MKKLSGTPQSLLGSIIVAQRIAFLRGQEELLRLDHDNLHQQIVDVQEVLSSPPAVLSHMVGLQSTVFDVEAEVREARVNIRDALIQAYKDAGAQYAHFYAKEIFSAPTNATLTLVQKRSGKHKLPTENAVEIILDASWWQEYLAQERALLAERSRAEVGIAEISQTHADASAFYDSKLSQSDALRRMEASLEAQMLETSAELSKWIAIEAEGLTEVAIPTVAEKTTAGVAYEDLWSAHGESNVYVWSQTAHKLLAVIDLVQVPGNERDGIRFVTNEVDYAWSVKYANYRRTVSYPRAELVVVPRKAPIGATVVSSARLVSVMDTSG